MSLFVVVFFSLVRDLWGWMRIIVEAYALRCRSRGPVGFHYGGDALH